jgi:hypothetical protein
MFNHLPLRALSVRQPWAHAIMHFGKDIENRSWRPNNPALSFRGRIAIHAAIGMTRDEYTHACESILEICDEAVPHAQLLPRGAIVGSVEIVDYVTSSKSPWFFGPIGLVLANPIACDPIPARGALGIFNWAPSDVAVKPAAWMQRQGALV